MSIYRPRILTLLAPETCIPLSHQLLGLFWYFFGVNIMLKPLTDRTFNTWRSWKRCSKKKSRLLSNMTYLCYNLEVWKWNALWNDEKSFYMGWDELRYNWEKGSDVCITEKKSSFPLTSAEFVANQWVLSIDAHQFFFFGDTDFRRRILKSYLGHSSWRRIRPVSRNRVSSLLLSN